MKMLIALLILCIIFNLYVILFEKFYWSVIPLLICVVALYLLIVQSKNCKAYETIMIGLFLVIGIVMMGVIFNIPKIATVSWSLIVGGLYFGMYWLIRYFDKSFLEEENKEKHQVKEE